MSFCIGVELEQAQQIKKEKRNQLKWNIWKFHRTLNKKWNLIEYSENFGVYVGKTEIEL
jgi:hypothetical protein